MADQHEFSRSGCGQGPRSGHRYSQERRTEPGATRKIKASPMDEDTTKKLAKTSGFGATALRHPPVSPGGEGGPGLSSLLPAWLY
jgi:hypothetical protein